MGINGTKRAVLYARVSTDEQSEQMQLDELRAAIQYRGWQLVKEYVDHGASGMDDTRVQYQALRKDAIRRPFDVVIVWRFDRFARSTRELLLALEEFGSLGIDFVSLKEAIDTTTATGKLMFTIIAAFAEFERAGIVERVRSGMDRYKREHDGAWGRRKTVLDPAAMALARALKAEGRGWRTVAKETGIPVGILRDRLAEPKTEVQS